MHDQAQANLPETSNCFGQIWSAHLGNVCNTTLRSGPWEVRRCDRSQYDGHWRLHLEVADVLDLESEGPLQDGSYLFNGMVETSVGRGEQCLVKISNRLADAGIPHVLELYDPEGRLARRFHHLWPEELSRPRLPLWQNARP